MGGFIAFLIVIFFIFGFTILVTVADYESQHDQTKKELSQITRQLGETNELLYSKNAQIETLTDENNNLSHQIESLTNSVEANQNRISLLQNELTDKVNQIEEQTRIIDQKTTLLSELEGQVSSLRGQLTLSTTQLGETNERLQTVLAGNESLSTENEVLKSEKSSLLSEIEAKESEVSSLTTTLNEKVNKITELESLISEKDSVIEQHEENIRNLEASIASRPDEIRELEDRIQSEEETIQRKNREIEVLTIEKQDLETRFQEVCNNLVSLRSDKNTLSERIQELERQINHLQNEYDNIKHLYTDSEKELSALRKQMERKEPVIPPVQVLDKPSEPVSEPEQVPESPVAEKSETEDEPETVSEPEPEPESPVAQEPRTEDEPKDSPEPTTDTGPEPETPADEKPGTEEEPEPVSEPEPVPESPADEEPGTEEELEPISEPEPEPECPADEESGTEDEPEEYPETESEPEGRGKRVNSLGSPVRRRSSTRKKTNNNEPVVQNDDYLDGSTIDFPEITNDSNRQTRRTIEYVYDENESKIEAEEFFRSSPEKIALVSRKMKESEMSGLNYWTCGLCHRRVKIAKRTYGGIESLFFTHASRDHNCPWIKRSTSSRDKSYIEEILADDDMVQEEELQENLPNSQKLKEMIFSMLTTSVSEGKGISDVQMDEVIKSKVPYMRWRRPDISFVYKGRKVVIELQKKSHGIDAIVDRDVFFRLNNIHILWVFGSDSDTSYDYMRKLSYKNTMFDNHHNVFVFDKEAQSKSEENNTLYLKCNWLEADDSWHFKIDTHGANGKFIGIEDLTFDDEYCKPYYFDANESYFLKNPNAREDYLAHKKTREELKKSIEEKWTRDPRYEEAQGLMRQRQIKVTPYCSMNIWGFRFNTTIIIPPIFTKEPEDQHNGYYLVCQGEKLGIVNYYGEKIVRWDGTIQCDNMKIDDINKRLYFSRHGLWGLANLSGVELIPASYQDIQSWTSSVYRVKRENGWGLCSIDNHVLVECKYEKIDELIGSRAQATKVHPLKTWQSVSGYIDETGKELITTKNKQTDGMSIVQSFELWGIIDEEGNYVLPCQYEEITRWADNLYRFKENGKWGIFNVLENTHLLSAEYDSIGDLKNGVATIIHANQETCIDVNGKEVAQEIIQLQDGLSKTRIAGKWGIVDANGTELVPHQYDEIGSFRSRMIGVINNGIIKLKPSYSHPIYISGKLIDTSNKAYLFNIAGAECTLHKSSLTQMGLSINQVCDANGVCKKLGFSNVMTKDNKKQYILRILNPEHLNSVLSHADREEDYMLGETYVGTIQSIKNRSKKGVKKRIKIKVVFDDDRQTIVPRSFFKSPMSIDNYNIGDTLTLKKVGFDDDLDRTIWEIQ